MSATEFATWVDRPENRRRWWELDRGRVIEMPPPKPPHGTVCGMIVYLLTQFAMGRRKGRVVSNDTGLIVEQNPDTVRGVDVMFFDESIPFEEVESDYSTKIPALVVEVWSPTDKRNLMNRRVAQFLARGVPVVWLVDPVDRTVAVHRPSAIPVILSGSELLSGHDALPDLSLTVSSLFTLPGQPPAAVTP
jgi:Uma2 family endonuclease